MDNEAIPLHLQRNRKFMAKALSVKLQDKDGDAWTRESWYGYGPFKVKFNDDDTATIGLPDTDVQIAPKQTNDYGDYFVAKFLGGTVFVSRVSHEKYGNYVRIKLGNTVELPSAVLEKIAYKPKASSGARAKPTAKAVW
jgi:hypothetical protein